MSQDFNNTHFTQEQADARTAELGFKVFSDAEISVRNTEKRNRRAKAMIAFLTAIVANAENVVMLDGADGEATEKAYKEPVNKLFAYAEENGLTINDIRAIGKNLSQIAVLLDTHENTVSFYMSQLFYNLTGENNYEEIPIRKIEDLVRATKKQ